jgi:hypothetical protein
MGALSEACVYITEAADPDAALGEIDDLLTTMLGAFQVDGTDPA